MGHEWTWVSQLLELLTWLQFCSCQCYNYFSTRRAAAYTQPNLNAGHSLIPLGFAVSFKDAKPTSYFQIKLDIWSHPNYCPLKWHPLCLGYLWSIFYGTESGSVSQMCRTYPVPPLPKNTQSPLSWEVFNYHAGQGLLSVIITLMILSPLPHHSRSSQDFFFKIKVDLCWKG